MNEQFEKLREKVAAFIEQVEFCGYECIAGALENNITFVEMAQALAECEPE